MSLFFLFFKYFFDFRSEKRKKGIFQYITSEKGSKPFGKEETTWLMIPIRKLVQTLTKN